MSRPELTLVDQTADVKVRCGAPTKRGRPCRVVVGKPGARCGRHLDSKVDRKVGRVAAATTRVEILEALRADIAERIDSGVQPRDLGTLSKRLMDIARELEQLTASDGADPVGVAAATPDESWDDA